MYIDEIREISAQWENRYYICDDKARKLALSGSLWQKSWVKPETMKSLSNNIRNVQQAIDKLQSSLDSWKDSFARAVTADKTNNPEFYGAPYNTREEQMNTYASYINRDENELSEWQKIKTDWLFL